MKATVLVYTTTTSSVTGLPPSLLSIPMGACHHRLYLIKRCQVELFGDELLEVEDGGLCRAADPLALQTPKFAAVALQANADLLGETHKDDPKMVKLMAWLIRAASGPFDSKYWTNYAVTWPKDWYGKPLKPIFCCKQAGPSCQSQWLAANQIHLMVYLVWSSWTSYRK